MTLNEGSIKMSDDKKGGQKKQAKVLREEGIFITITHWINSWETQLTQLHQGGNIIMVKISYAQRSKHSMR